MGQSESRCCSCCADEHLAGRSGEQAFASTLPMDRDEHVAWPPPNAPKAVSETARRGPLGDASVPFEMASRDSDGKSDKCITDKSTSAAFEKHPPETKRAIKKFVQSMVKGQQIDVVVAGSQKYRTVVVSLTKELNALAIKSGEKHQREISLAMVEAVHVGQGAAAGNRSRDADSMLVTLELSNRQCIKFRAKDEAERDMLAMCLTLFSDHVRKKTTRV
eukprot:TRINITY_DN47280_c0_g1_i1.p1 TRINITY_DN47280_c0_g1~~TRINITY_DN47280_c0_g1_i1.p1  ORF type:complete len:219 (-),score=43.66 TRINITY_DN47280_c0_g1_i1:84-740(-)